MGSIEPRLKTAAHTTVQVLVLVGTWWLANMLVKYLSLPIPAGVLGLALLAALLFSGILPSRTLMLGAQWLLAEMLLFFMPSLMAITDYSALIKQEGIVLLIVLTLGCLVVMAGTAWVVEAVLKLERKRHAQNE